MAKYLFTTLPSNDLGLLTRSLPIARELRDRGHQIAFCSPAKAPKKLVSEAGFDNLLPTAPSYYIISGDISSESLSRLLHSRHLRRDVRILISFIKNMVRSSTAEIWNIDHFMYQFGMWNEEFIRANVEALMELICAYGPDAIVDFWNPFACIAARASRKPLITVIQADMHPQSKGFIWWKKTPTELYPSPVPATNIVLAEYHVPPIRTMGELLIGEMTLVVGLPEIDPLPETADVTYIGPILWQRQNEKLPEWITDLSSEQPLIWLYPGNLQYVRGTRTSFDSAVVLKASIEALGNQAVQVVLTTGHHSLPRCFIPLPSNFRHEPYVPGLAMAERSDLLIHHGGYGSCQTGLYTGKPALIIPTYSERESNARRIAAQGAADFVIPKSDAKGRKKQVSAEEVRTKVFTMLSNESFAHNAKRISKRMKTYGGAAEAARLIESLVRA
jgi:UDP:flavonoid glycosyltransferase YjiC (YdhE family)